MILMVDTSANLIVGSLPDGCSESRATSISPQSWLRKAINLRETLPTSWLYGELNWATLSMVFPNNTRRKT